MENYEFRVSKGLSSLIDVLFSLPHSVRKLTLKTVQGRKSMKRVSYLGHLMKDTKRYKTLRHGPRNLITSKPLKAVKEPSKCPRDVVSWWLEFLPSLLEPVSPTSGNLLYHQEHQVLNITKVSEVYFN